MGSPPRPPRITKEHFPAFPRRKPHGNCMEPEEMFGGQVPLPRTHQVSDPPPEPPKYPEPQKEYENEPRNNSVTIWILQGFLYDPLSCASAAFCYGSGYLSINRNHPRRRKKGQFGNRPWQGLCLRKSNVERHYLCTVLGRVPPSAFRHTL